MIFGRNKIIKNAVIQTAKPNLNFPYRHYPANGQWVGTHSLSALSSPCIHIVTYIIYYIDADVKEFLKIISSKNASPKGCAVDIHFII